MNLRVDIFSCVVARLVGGFSVEVQEFSVNGVRVALGSATLKLSTDSLTLPERLVVLLSSNLQIMSVRSAMQPT